MNADPARPDRQDDERTASDEPRVAEAGRGARRPMSREIARVLTGVPRPHSANVVVPPVLHGLLKEAARRERTALAVIVVRALRAYLSREHPDLHRQLMPLPTGWDAARSSAQAAPPPQDERPT